LESDKEGHFNPEANVNDALSTDTSVPAPVMEPKVSIT
jgi:hypothetical protein